VFYTCVGGICLSRTEATWSTRPWPSLQQRHRHVKFTPPTNHQGISDLAIVPTNNCNPHNMWKYSLKPIFVLTLPHCLAASARRTPNCAQNLATFGGQTTIKSILLTFCLVWGGSLRCKLPLYTKGKVNRIDLIVVPTPKFPKFCAQLGVRRADAAKQWGKVSTNIGFHDYFHMLCRLQLFVGTITRSLMPWWLVGSTNSRPRRAAVVKVMVGCDQVASVRKTQIPPTHV
jgi:hypothetical protein